MEGFLVVFDKKKKWKRRYVSVDGDLLQVYESKRDKEANSTPKVFLSFFNACILDCISFSRYI